MTTPRIRDYTDTGRTTTVEVIVSPAAELVASLFALAADVEDESAVSDPRRQAWVDAAEAALPIDLLDDIRLSGDGADVWLAFGRDPRDGESVDDFIDRMASLDPVEVRRETLKLLLHRAPEEEVEAAAKGENEALDRLEAACGTTLPSGLRRLLEEDTAALRDDRVAVMRRFDEAVFHGGQDVVATLERDAEEKRSLAGRLATADIVEQATNGVTFTPGPDVHTAVLVPSVAIHPWVVITEREGRKAFVYPVSDEHLDADPDAPPMHLVDLFKALGDERRLRILRILAEGPATLKELTARLDLAKSTVFHHLRTLRTAGLVRVVVDDDKEYSLRTGAVPEATDLLDRYLS
ncbi:MAG: metalloregulator ArsR/SmtB family transcription factor [Acidimicrobiia bacterium]|nr:metalloregulator ArsR/SmtB family transcription factor [Acidimicrobiia bacterium]